MSIDFSWLKATGLAAGQAAAHTALAALGAGVINVLHLDYEQIAGLSGGAALASVLGAVVAYKLPDGPAQAVSAASPLTSQAPVVSDSDEAR